MADEHNPNEELERDLPVGTGGLRPLLERLTRRHLGDLRIHDSSQAGDLARRLGARAFTVGRDVYVQPELLRPLTPRSVALLAHEITHVAEQTGAPALPLAQGMPHVSPPPAPPLQSTASGGVTVQRQAAPGARLPIQRQTQGQTPAQTSSEARAEETESQVLQESQEGGRKKRPPPDPEDLADRVYHMIVQELKQDHERAAYGWK